MEDEINEIRYQILLFEQKYDQGYVHLTICSSSFDWGFINWRKALSGGAEGELEFTNIEHLLMILKELNND